MNVHPSPLRPHRNPSRRLSGRRRLRPYLDSLEDRTVLSSWAVPGAAHEALTAVHHHAALVSVHAHAHAHAASTLRHHGAGGTSIGGAATVSRHHHTGGSKLHHHKGQEAASGATTSAPTPAPAPTPASTPVAAAAAPASAPASSSSTDPTILTVSINPIDLKLLGLEVQLYGQDTSSPVTVTVSAQPGSGELLGNLLTDVAGLLNVQGVSNALDSVLNNVVSLVNQSSLSINGLTGSTTYTSTTPVLDAYIAPVNLNLLGAVVTTSPINLVITAHSGSGLALGNIVTDLANVLNGTTGNIVNNVENGLSSLLNTLNQQFPNIASAPLPSPSPTPSGALQVLSLTVPPIDLNLLGLILQTSTIQVNATAQSGNGQLLGNLLVDLLNSAHVSQTNLSTINSDLNAVLAKVVGILNVTTLSIPTTALSSLSPTLQELLSPTLIDTTGAAVPPQPILNLSVASSNGTPPVDVDLLGVVVTTSNIDIQLLAQPGQGQILGNLLYNASHLLDGGLLSVLGILNTLGI